MIDEEIIKDLISTMSVDVSIFNIKRIGNSSNKNRPLRIIFKDASDVVNILNRNRSYELLISLKIFG